MNTKTYRYTTASIRRCFLPLMAILRVRIWRSFDRTSKTRVFPLERLIDIWGASRGKLPNNSDTISKEDVPT